MTETPGTFAAPDNTQKPWLLLDIDGVLNPIEDQTHRGFQRHHVHGYDVQLSAEHGRILTELVDEGIIDLRWATTWNQAADRYIAPIVGLPRDLPILPIDWGLARPAAFGYNWKADSVKAMTEGVPFAWFDDFLTPEDRSWAETRILDSGTPTLLVPIDPRIGMLPEHVQRVREWARSVTGPPPITATDLLRRTPDLAANPIAADKAAWLARTAHAMPATVITGETALERTQLITALWDRCAAAIVADHPGPGLQPTEEFTRQALRRYLRGDGEAALVWAERAALRAEQPHQGHRYDDAIESPSPRRLVLPATPDLTDGYRLQALIDSGAAELGINPDWQRVHRSVQVGPDAPIVQLTIRADREDTARNLTVAFGHAGDVPRHSYEDLLRGGPAGILAKLDAVDTGLTAGQATQTLDRIASRSLLTGDPRAAASLAAIAVAYDLDETQRTAVQDAYEVTRAGSGPFIVAAAADMLTHLKEEADAHPQARVVFLGRDGHSYAAAIKELDPGFFTDHCSEIVLSRVLAEAAVLDLESHGARFPGIDSFRSRARVSAEAITDASRHLTRYLEQANIPVGTPGSRVTLVDNGVRGTIQELLTAMYGETQFTGRYGVFISHPDDPHPGTKHGHVVHQDQTAASWRGNYVTELPDDPQLTFTHRDAIAALEDTLDGPFTSPTSFAANTPVQGLLRESPDQLDGLNPALVAEPYRDPLVREAVKVAGLLAVADTAADIARARDAGQDWTGQLAAATDRFVSDVRLWIKDARGRVSDPRQTALLDSFVLRQDRWLIRRLTAALNERGYSFAQALPVWQNLANLTSMPDKHRFVERIERGHHAAPESPRVSTSNRPRQHADRTDGPPAEALRAAGIAASAFARPMRLSSSRGTTEPSATPPARPAERGPDRGSER